jgi:putative transposase
MVACSHLPGRIVEVVEWLIWHLAALSNATVADMREVSAGTLRKWKAKFGGLEASDAKRLRSLEDENRKLKKLLAEAMLDNAALKDLLAKN